MAEPLVMNPQHPVESHFREFLQPQHNNSKARYDKFESSKLLAEKDNNELLHKRIQNSKAKKVSSQHMGKAKDFPLEPYMVPPQFQRNNYYIDQYHHPHHNLQPVHQPFYAGHVEKMQPTILPQTQHDNKNGYNVGLHQQSNSSPLHHDVKLQQQSNSSPLHHDVKLQSVQDTNALETKAESNTGKRPPSPSELDNNAKKANFDLDVSDLNTSQEKDDELDKILPLSLIMGDKWAELGTELNLEMFNDSVWDKSMEKPSSPEAKDTSTASNSSEKQPAPQQPVIQPMNTANSLINGIKTENEPSPLSKIPPPNVTIGGPPTNGVPAPAPPQANRSRSTSLNSPQLMNNNHTLQGLPNAPQPVTNQQQQNPMKKEQQSPHHQQNGAPQQIGQMNQQMGQNMGQQQQMVNQQQQHLSQQQIQQLNLHHQQQQHLMMQKQQQQQQLSQQNMPKHGPLSSQNNMVSIGSMVTTSPALAHRAQGNKAPNGQYMVQNPRSPLTQMAQQPGKMSHGNPTSPLTAVTHSTGHPTGPGGPPGHPTGHPTGPQGHQNGPPGHPTGVPGHPSGPQGHPNGPTGHPAGHPTGPPGHPSGPPGHPSGPPGHPVSQDTSMLNRSSVPNVTVTTGYRPQNGNTPEEARMATVQRQQVKNALHQKIKENALQGQNNKQKLQNEELHRVQSFGAASVSLPQNLVPARMAFNNQGQHPQQGQYPGNMMSGGPNSQFAGQQGYPYDRNYHYILQQQQQQHMMQQQQQQLYYQQMRANDPNHHPEQGMPGWGGEPHQGMTQQQYIQRQQIIQHQQQQMRLQQQAMYQQSGEAPVQHNQVPSVPKTDGLTSKSEPDIYNRTIMGMQSRNVVCTLPQQRQQLHPNSPPVHHPQHPGQQQPHNMMSPHNIQYNNMIQQQHHPAQHHMAQQPMTRHISPQQSRIDQQQLLHQQQMQQMNGTPPRAAPPTPGQDPAAQMAHPTLNDVSKFSQNNVGQMIPNKGPNLAPTSAVSSPNSKQELPESPFNPSLFNNESDFTEDIDSFLQGFDMSTFDR